MPEDHLSFPPVGHWGAAQCNACKSQKLPLWKLHGLETLSEDGFEAFCRVHLPPGQPAQGVAAEQVFPGR